MKGTIVRLNPAAHDEAQTLLPWYALDRLAADERQRVSEHLVSCPRCQADLAREMQLVLAGRVEAPAGEATAAGWQRLQARLDAPRPTLSASLGHGLNVLRDAWRGSASMMRYAVLAQALGLVGLALLLAWPQPAGEVYHVLGTPRAVTHADAVVVFRADATVAQMQAALAVSDARIVDGPTAAGVYLVTVSARAVPDAMAQLRQQPGVQFAESLGAAPGAKP